jgi:hypothetical protein
VCDQPHPAIVKEMLSSCAAGDLQKAYVNMKSLCDMGYSAVDIITTVFKVRACLLALSPALSGRAGVRWWVVALASVSGTGPSLSKHMPTTPDPALATTSRV